MKINLASTRMAFFLIAILLILVLISAIIPQQDFTEALNLGLHDAMGGNYQIIETLGLDRIFYTPVFFIVLGLLGLNLAVGNIKRFRTVYRVEKTLLKLRHLGSIIFHLSLLVIMSGIILHFLHRYEGRFSLTEGQTLADRASDYHREFKGPLFQERYNRFRITLINIIDTLDASGAPVDKAQVEIELRDRTKKRGEISTNHPLPLAGIDFHYGASTGYSPELIIINLEGERLFSGIVRVAAQEAPDGIKHHDFVEIEQLGLKISFVIAQEETISDQPPVDIEISRSDSVLWSGTITQSDTASFENMHLMVPRLRRWCYIGAVQNPFLYLVFFGFWTAIAGMTLGFISRVMKK